MVKATSSQSSSYVIYASVFQTHKGNQLETLHLMFQWRLYPSTWLCPSRDYRQHNFHLSCHFFEAVQKRCPGSTVWETTAAVCKLWTADHWCPLQKRLALGSWTLLVTHHQIALEKAKVLFFMQVIAVKATELPRYHIWERKRLPQLQMEGNIYDAIFLVKTETQHI